MKIIKRNGAEVPFDITKIITAVSEDRDGTPVRPEEAPVCPECGAPLRQVAIRKGPHAGSMAWLCSNDGGHASGRSRFFEDRDGKPVLS